MLGNQRIIVVIQRLIWHSVRTGYVDDLAVRGRRLCQVHRFDGCWRHNDRIRTSRIQAIRVVAVAISHWYFEQLYVGAQLMNATIIIGGYAGHVICVAIVVVQRCRGGNNRSGLVQMMDNVLSGRVHSSKVR